MIASKTYKESYISYLMFEIFMVAITTGIMIACFVFYAGVNSAKRGPGLIDFLINDGSIYLIISVIPAFISVIFVLFYRRRNYIVGFKVDEEYIHMQVRGLSTKSLKEITIKRSDSKISKFEDPAFLIVPRYKGYRIIDQSTGRKFEYVSNNFIWEKQIKDNILILKMLELMTK